jgi:ribonuclease D
MSAIDTAISAAKHPILLDNSAQLARAYKIWRKSEVLGIDTEFLRERTYWAKLGLVQVSDGQTAWLIDPIAIDSLDPLRDILVDDRCVKVFHSPTEDLEVLLNSLSISPERIVDTQLACAMLGQPLQLSYHNAAQWLLEVPVSKDQTRSDWTARPLTSEQMHYAALDVTLLPVMWSSLKPQLMRQNRLGWLTEDGNRLLQSSRTPIDEQQTYLRIKGSLKLNPDQLRLLRNLAAWRENQAKKQDLPRGFVIKDHVLLQLALMKPKSPEDLAALVDLHPKTLKRHGAHLITLSLGRGIENGPVPVINQLDERQRKVLGAMRQHVVNRAKVIGVDPALLASKKELEKLIRSQIDEEEAPERFLGWRFREITEQLLSIYQKSCS